MTSFEKSYEASARNLEAKARELLAERSWDLRFNFPALLWDTSMMVTGALPALEQFARNEDSRNWLQKLDELTSHECTIAQFCMVVMPQLQRLRFPLRETN